MMHPERMPASEALLCCDPCGVGYPFWEFSVGVARSSLNPRLMGLSRLRRGERFPSPTFNHSGSPAPPGPTLLDLFLQDGCSRGIVTCSLPNQHLWPIFLP